MSKTAKAAGENFLPKIPKEKYTIPDSRSIIHWDEIYKTQVVVRRGCRKTPYTKWLVPVTCGRRVSPQCRGKRDVVVLRGMTGPEPLTPECLTSRGSTYSGICLPCLRTTFPNLLNGSEVYVDDVTEEGVLVKCGECNALRRVRRISEPKKFTGLCLSCGVRAAVGVPDHNHPVNGARIYSSRPVSEGPNKGKWPFRCTGCGSEAYAWSHQTRSRKWQGLCPGCRERMGYTPRGGSPPKVTEDDYLPLTGAPVFFSRRKGKNGKLVPVQCVYPVAENEGRICGVEHDVNFKVLRRNWNDATGFCPKHEISGRLSRRDAYAAIQALQASALSGNGQLRRGSQAARLNQLKAKRPKPRKRYASL